MARKIATPRLTKKDYEARLPRLREQLVQLQVTLKDAPFPVLLVIAGVEGAGRGDLINTLNGWLDPRGVETFSFHPPTDEERERPLMWRFWRSLPQRGRMGIYAGSWYTETLRETARDSKVPVKLDHELHRIRQFERLLADDGALILKVWLHLSKAAQRKRLRDLTDDERTAWRVTPDDWRHHRLYDQLARTSGRILRATHQPAAPWFTVEAGDERGRDIAVADLLLARFRDHARRVKKIFARGTRPGRAATTPLRPSGLRQLLALPLDQELSAADYEEKRDKWLGRLSYAVRAAATRRRSVIFIFEGWDAAGKGGAIRRLTSAIDARDYRVIPVAKPTDEEKAHHYLWRFWRHVPRAGMVTIYDRSWYGRVLVERLEGFCREAEWRRAFAEINDFEEQLAERGLIVVKLWMHISKDEQLRRFREREDTAYKRHKINDEDWRNRRKWHAYEVAVGDMLALTDKSFAPWNLIPANNKRHARLQILKVACRQIETALTGE
ncbi:MAG TPA: polyphosphate:AMP phosphotransferase [Opitutaceae bacterium]|jgi:polyphosphate:AMP phosphotransferase|nr:polyphosphate:AMP phosphotransferase [Opitutaceae bacterium]